MMSDLPERKAAEIPQCLEDVERPERKISTLIEVCHRLGEITQSLTLNNFESESDVDDACESAADLLMAVNDLYEIVGPSIAEERKEYKGVVCRGSWALGTACGVCERCEDTRRAPPAGGE